MGKGKSRKKRQRQATQSKQVTLEESRSEVYFYGGQKKARRTSGKSTTKLLEAYSNSPWLHAVVHKISQSFAGIEWTVSVPVVGGETVRRPAIQRAANQHKAGRAAKEKQLELVELPIHPMLELLAFGNPLLDGHSVAQVQQSYMELTGEYFTAKQRNATGMPVALWPMSPAWVLEVPTAESPFYRVTINGLQSMIPAADVIWSKDPNPLVPYSRGVGTGEAISQELDVDEYASAFMAAYFYNGAIPDALIGFEGASQESVRQAEYRWNQENRGPTSAHRVKFFNKEPKVIRLGAEFKDAPLVELRKFERDSIHQVFGLPPEMLGIVTNSNRATIEAAETIFGRWVLEPRAERQRITLQNQLAPDFDERLVVGYVSPVPDDKSHQLEVMKTASWAATRNEWRARMSLEPTQPDQEVFLQPAGVFERPVDGEPVTAPQMAPVGLAAKPQAQKVIPARAKALTPLDIDRLIEEGIQVIPIQNNVDELMEGQTLAWAQRSIARWNLGISFSMVNPRVLQRLRDLSANKIKRINDGTKKQVRDILTEAVAAGEGGRDIAKRLKGVVREEYKNRSLTIARTEVLGQSNWVSNEAFRQSGAVEGKRWITTLDGRERDAHRAMNFQLRPIDGEFTAPSGATTQAPGEFGVPELDINCRCDVIPVIDITEARGNRRDMSDAVCKGLAEETEAARTGWQVKLALAYRRAFREQLRQMLRILEQVDR